MYTNLTGRCRDGRGGDRNAFLDLRVKTRAATAILVFIRVD